MSFKRCVHDRVVCAFREENIGPTWLAIEVVEVVFV